MCLFIVVFNFCLLYRALYNAKKGYFVNLEILDVLQIFGHAGRPQFDTHGDAYIITTHDKLSHYLALMTWQMPIENQFISSLTDNLNAEVAIVLLVYIAPLHVYVASTYYMS